MKECKKNLPPAGKWKDACQWPPHIPCVSFRESVNSGKHFKAIGVES